LRPLPEEILWNQKRLKEAWIEQFEEVEANQDAQENIMSIVSGLKQGECTVFAYSRKAVRIFHGKPAKVHQFDKMLIRYYIEGLAS